MRLMIALSALCFSAALSGCAFWTEQPVAVEIQTVKVVPPDSLLTCPARPAVPPAPLTESAVMVYVAQLRFAHADCAGKIEELRRFYQGE
jgi:hypothetical protein